jgi:hypothetical protein
VRTINLNAKLDDIGKWTDICAKFQSTLLAKVLETNDPSLAYHYAKFIGREKSKMQSIILASNNPRYATLFAMDVPNADIKSLQALVIKANKPTYLVHFAALVPAANHRALLAAVVKSNSSAATGWLKFVSSSAVKTLQPLILASDNPTHLLELAHHLKGTSADCKTIRKIEDFLIGGGYVKECRVLAQLPLANKKRLEKAVVKSGNANEIKKLVDNDIAEGLKALF